jgi:hypothetical protein
MNAAWSIRDRLASLGAQIEPGDLVVARFAEALSLRVTARSGGGWLVVVNDDTEPGSPIWQTDAEDEVDLGTAVYLAVGRVVARQIAKAGGDAKRHVRWWHGPRHGECERCGYPVLGTGELLAAVDSDFDDDHIWVCASCLAAVDRWRDRIFSKRRSTQDGSASQAQG